MEENVPILYVQNRVTGNRRGKWKTKAKEKWSGKDDGTDYGTDDATAAQVSCHQ